MGTTPAFGNSLIEYRSPHPALHSFIEHYVFRKFTVPDGCCIQKLMPPRSACSIDFFLGDCFETIDLQTGESVSFNRCMIRGPRTDLLYSIRIKGTFISFVIKFKPTGLYRLLGIPMDMFANKAIDASIISDIPLKRITEKLVAQSDLSHCIELIEPYLIFLSGKSKRVPPIIEKSACLLKQCQELHPITQLANESFLSQRQFERHFIKYIGVSPKTYYRMHRFLQLLNAKNKEPEQKWGSLAHEFGYYDQMHLVKDFKSFLKTTPSSFITADFAF